MSVSMTYVRISRAAAVRGRLLFGSRDCTLNSTFGRSIFESRQVPVCHSRSAAIAATPTSAHRATSRHECSSRQLPAYRPILAGFFCRPRRVV